MRHDFLLDNRRTCSRSIRNSSESCGSEKWNSLLE